MLRNWLGALLVLACLLSGQWAAGADFSDAVVVISDQERFATPAEVLVEEIERRTGVRWDVADQAGRRAAVVFQAAKDDELGREGFSIATETGPPSRLILNASGRRGALFAVGYLLRHLECPRGAINLPDPIETTQIPEYPIRGHQLGYRAQANSYDAWDPAVYDQYIRELVFFGANAIENIPFQDDRPTPIMPVSRPEMNRALSRICDKYDLNYWVWTPADYDLSDPDKRAAGLRFHEEFYRQTPRLDAIFFPGGDPGDNHPQDVLPFLADLAEILANHHPQARIWMSLQGFEGEKTDYVFDWIAKHQPAWLGGIVGGPGSPPLRELRERLDPRYQLRDYPDITHVVRCQYPETNLDQVFALTAGREPINPRPIFYAGVFDETARFTNGFISYSDGCQDDVNKALWSARGWESLKNPREILVEYARCFFGSRDADAIAEGILALEQNWNGSLRENAGVAATLDLWQQLEAAHPELAGNWRWQMLLTRAYYDAYQRERLIAETELEQQAYRQLDPATGQLPSEAIAAARAVLSRAEAHPVRPDLRNRLLELFDQLYASIRFQSSVEKYHAIHPQRGCMLDFLDYPLNNRFWLEDEFHKVLTLPTAEARRQRLDELRTWEQPGEGSYYDDLGHVGRSPRAVRDPHSLGAGSYWWVDNGMSRRRLSWLVTGTPADLYYERLDPQAEYRLRFSGYGDLKPRAEGQLLEATLYETAENTFKEFPVPSELVADGKLSVTFDSVYLEGVNWRRQPRLAEAWLLKGKPAK